MRPMSMKSEKERRKVAMSGSENKDKKRKKRILWLLLLLLVIGVAGGIYYVLTNKSERVQIVSGDYLPGEKDAKKMSDKELKEAEQQVVDDSKFNMVIKSEATFETGESKGNLYIQNPVQNGYPINVDIHLDDTNEKVYSSGAMQPGYEVSGAVLETKLTAGVYPATATFTIFDPKTNKKRGQVQAAITLTVRN